MLVTDIVWDTDGEKVELPTEVEIPNDIEEDEIADYLSDEYGWCVESFNVNEKHNGHINEVIYRFLLNIMDSSNATDIADVLTPKVIEDINETAGGDFGDCNIYKALTKVLKSALGMN
jgi:hypothetical protein